MKLLVDVGNQRLKWTPADRVRMPASVCTWRGEHWPSLLDRIWHDLLPEGVYISNVAGPDVEHEIQHYCHRRWQLTAQFLRSEAQAKGLRNAYKVPQQLGADRWAAMLGALQVSAASKLIVDCGTAVTVDLVDASGSHLGGAIFPGLSTMRGSLRSSTAQLNVPDAAAEVFATDTAAAIAGGTLQALIGGLLRYRHLAEQRLQAECTVLVCGGDSESVMEQLGPAASWEPNLVMYGLIRRFDIS